MAHERVALSSRQHSEMKYQTGSATIPSRAKPKTELGSFQELLEFADLLSGPFECVPGWEVINIMGY